MHTRKKFLAIIPAKKKSYRIKNKNFIKFKGRTLVDHTINIAKKSKYLNYIYVSTDSSKIRSLAEKNKLSLLKLRPKKFSGRYSTMHSVIKYEIKYIKNKFDYIVILQPTSPLRTSLDIDKACKKIMKNPKADCLVSCTKLPENFYPKKIMVKSNNYLEFLDLNSIFLNNIKIYNSIKIKNINFKTKTDKNKKLYFRNGSIYIIKKSNINKFLVGGKILKYEMPLSKSLDINTNDDLNNLF